MPRGYSKTLRQCDFLFHQTSPGKSSQHYTGLTKHDTRGLQAKTTTLLFRSRPDPIMESRGQRLAQWNAPPRDSIRKQGFLV